MDINEVTTTEDLWTPYKELVAVVDSYLSSDSGGAPYAVHTFESVLRRHKQTFLSLLKNPPKNPNSREEIKRGVTEGVTLPSIGRTVLSKELVDEAIIISDMFNVNEYLALELLHTAQRQGPRHPGLARGLLACALYYDGRRALLQALKELVTARHGVCWSISAREDIVKYVSRYVEQLMQDGLLGGVLDALRRYTLAGELELLQNNRALPPREHHAKLVKCIEGTRYEYVSRYVEQLMQDGLLAGVLDALRRYTLAGELELLQNNRALPPREHHAKLVKCIEGTRYEYVSRYVEQLMQDGLLAGVLDALRRYTLAGELELLQNNRALPPREHHAKLVKCIEGTRYEYVSRYVEQLMQDGLLAGVLDALRRYTLAGELELLQNNRALPPREHHAKLVKCIEGTRYEYVSRYVEQLMQDGLLAGVLDALRRYTLAGELELLQNNRALPPREHHAKLVKCIEGTRYEYVSRYVEQLMQDGLLAGVLDALRRYTLAGELELLQNNRALPPREHHAKLVKCIEGTRYEYVSRYVEQLMQDGLLAGVLDALRRYTLAGELELLQNNRALPPREHHAKLVKCIEGTRYEYVSRYVEQLMQDGLLAGVLDALRRYTLAGELELLQNNRALPPREHHVKLVKCIEGTRYEYVSRYVEQLMQDGLLGGVLDALRRYTLAGELELLQNNRALPPREHHAKLVKCIEGTRYEYVSRYVEQLMQDGLLAGVLDALRRYTLAGELELLQNNRALPPREHHAKLVKCIEGTRYEYVSRYVEQLMQDGLLAGVLDALRRYTLAGELELLQNNRALPPREHHAKLVKCIEGTRYEYVSRYVEQLMQDGLLAGVLDALRRYTLAGELELLQNNRALPPREHHAKLVKCIEGTRKLLAGVVFAASAQRGLERETLLRLINEQTTAPTQGPTGALDEVSLGLQMALLYALDLSVLHRREDGEELAKKLPLIQDPELISILIDELLPNSRFQPKEPKTKAGMGARALCQLSLGLALAALRRAPQSLSHAREQSHRDEELVDAAVDNKVFEYLDEAILSTDWVMQEEYYQRRVHALLTDFIVLMHPKLVEMRVKADEAARAIQVYIAEGLAPPPGAGQSRTRLDALLRCVERLYSKDPLQLRQDYWQAMDQHPPNRSGGRATILYKFVRLSGELVCPMLLPGYLRLLASLTVPRHTWALLARRDALVSHMLSALRRYHCNLRTDLAPFSDHMHSSSLGASAILTPAARPGKMLVRHEEVEAMIAALKLISAVAREDPAAAATICETLQWDAVNTMFGLMCCQIPIQLKAELCTTLAALGATAGPSGRVWASLEAAQLVAADRQQRGLRADLNEIETRMEEYPLTIAFLNLLISLCLAGPLPRSLGAGARPPGLDPYVEYVVNNVALAAPHRPYKRPQQKHQILALCFRLFTIWLEQYEPSPADWPSPERASAAAPPPGFRVLTQLHTQTDLLKLTLSALDDAALLTDEPPYLEECITHVLTILERALSLERGLVHTATEAGRSVLVLGLSKLILEPSPGSEDRLTSCCRLLQHAGSMPELTARAAALLSRALLHHRAAQHLHSHLHHAAQCRHWFVECLEAEEWGESSAVRRAKELVVGLLQHLLPSPAPNLAHLLLGYRNSEDISQSALHEPGVAGTPRTCLHSILDLLDAHIAPQNSHERQADQLIESSYHLVYWLCARANTSAPALRLLRARDHFLSRHVRATVNLQTANVATLSSRSWVLRACASEVGAACAARQHAAITALLRTLAKCNRADHEWEGEGCLLRRCLTALPVSAEPPPEPQWELFNPTLLAQAVANCDLPAGGNSKRISVSRVHALLMRDLAALPVNQPQRALVSAEIQKVLDYVTEVNKQRNLAASLTHYYDSWRQLTEIIFCVVPQDLLKVETKKNLLISVLQDILNKIPPSSAQGSVIPQLAVLASGSVLLLLVNLRHCYLIQRRESNMKTSDFETTFFGSSQIVQTKSLPLKFILHKILSWIFVSGDQTQKLRVNLYGSLLNFLNIVNLKSNDDEDHDTTYVSRLDSSKIRPNKEESSLKSMVIDDLGYYGVNLYSIIGADCVRAGHDACRMVALACIDCLIDIDPRMDWIDTLSNQGFLRSLIDSLVSDDDGLREAVEPNPRSLRVLYLYETKMALMIKVAGTTAGAESLLAHGALQALAELKVLRAHPDIHAQVDAQEFVPHQGDRYRQVLIPALALCDALLTTLGCENESCVQLIMHLLFTNVECVDMVLRAAHPTSPPGLLSSAEWLTSVLARCSGCAAFNAGDERAVERVARTRLLMAALLPRFQRAPAGPDRDLTQYYKIVCNILVFTRNTVEAWSAGREPSAALPPPAAVLAVLQDCVQRAHSHYKAPHNIKAILPSTTGGDPAVCSHCARLQHAACLALQLLWRMAVCSRHSHTAPALNGTWQPAPGLVSTDLRKELATTFSERFTDSLLDTAETQSTQRFFLDVIVKDIKTMMQF